MSSYRIHVALLILLLAGPSPSLAQSPSALWPAYATLLERYTLDVDAKVGTKVDYRGLSKAPAWQALVVEVSRSDPSALKGRDEELAYWINVYNIFAIDLILKNYPLESIRDIGSFFSPVWKREAGKIAGRGYSLGEIEHEILRPMGEARIHAAIVCASISCPNLRREPFEAERLGAQLDDSFRAWLARPEKGLRVDEKRGVLWLSPIFNWFEEDFEAQGGVIVFLEPHAPDVARRWLSVREGAFDEIDVEYFDYDWNLNE